MNLSCSKILTEEEMAKRLGISPTSLMRLRLINKVPWHRLMGRPRYYEDEVVEAFLNDDLNRGLKHDKEERNKIRRSVRCKGQDRGPGILEKLYLSEGRIGMD